MAGQGFRGAGVRPARRRRPAAIVDSTRTGQGWADMYTLYYSPGSASMAVHLALLETGASYTDWKNWTSLAARSMRPNIAASIRGDRCPRWSSTARRISSRPRLLLLLAERHPEARPCPSAGGFRSDLRICSGWRFSRVRSVRPYRLWFYPDDLEPGEPSASVRDGIRQKIEDGWTIIDTHLGASGPYLLGTELSMRRPAGHHVHALVTQHAEAGHGMAGAAALRCADARAAELEKALCDRGTDGVGQVGDRPARRALRQKAQPPPPQPPPPHGPVSQGLS